MGKCEEDNSIKGGRHASAGLTLSLGVKRQNERLLNEADASTTLCL